MTEPRPPDSGTGPLIVLSGVTLAFGPKLILQDLSFTINRGSIFAIMGGSGCGKSTVLQSMIGLLRPGSGLIRVAGEDYWACGEERSVERADSRRKCCFAATDVHKAD
jgi:phospholipid/cholesterol/gamma-HCH transport system ATP-binding protein